MKVKRKQQKVTLSERFTAGVPSFVTVLKNALFSIPCLLVALVLSYVCCLNLIGNGAYGYSEQMYTNLIDTVKACLFNQDTALQEENSITEFTPGYDVALLQENVDKCTAEYENGQTTLVCVKQNGFFKAKITAVLNKEFVLTAEPTRNFNSFEQYITHFWGVFGLSILGLAILSWLILEGIFYGCLRLAIAYSRKKLSAAPEGPVMTVIEESSTKPEKQASA